MIYAVGNSAETFEVKVKAAPNVYGFLPLLPWFLIDRHGPDAYIDLYKSLRRLGYGTDSE